MLSSAPRGSGELQALSPSVAQFRHAAAALGADTRVVLADARWFELHSKQLLDCGGLIEPTTEEIEGNKLHVVVSI